MFPAFIWHTYCPCRSKITNFQKLWYRKLENFRGQSRLLRRHLTAKLCNLEWCSKSLQTDKDASFHLRWCLGWFAWKLSIQEHENCCGVIPPPPAFRPTKYSGSFRVKNECRTWNSNLEGTLLFDTFEYRDWHLTYSHNWSFAVVSFIRAKVTLRVLPFITYVGLFEQIISIFPPPSPYLIWLRFHTDSKISEDILC